MIEKQDVQNLGLLARIELSEKEIEQLQKEFGDILGYISELGDAGSSNDQPQVGKVHTVLRDDTDAHDSGVYTEEILQEMRETQKGSLKDKKIL